MAVQPQDWPRIRRIFEEALARPEQGRSAFLVEACGGDRFVAEQVERMLAAHAQGAGFLDEPLDVTLGDATGVLEQRQVGPYQLQARIGAGGMGEVYRARDTRLHRTVAVKVLRARHALDPASRERFVREARAAAALNHPHICTLYDVGHEGDLDYLVMEHLEGETLAARVAAGPMPITSAIRCAAQIASALDMAHRSQIVHRDLKPGNIMLTRAGAKLLDFGLAKPYAAAAIRGAAQSPRDLAATGLLFGTPHYIAPEQLTGGHADTRSDIFAFGAVLYEMLTGQKAFAGTTQVEVLDAIVAGEPRRPSSVVPLVPPLVDQLVTRCLSKDPDERWQSAQDICFALQSLDGPNTSAGAPARKADGLGRRWAWPLAAGISAAALTLIIGDPRGMAAPPRSAVRLSLDPPDQTTFVGGFAAPYVALSPDGRQVAFVPTPLEGTSLLWIRELDAVTSRSLPGTDGVTLPFWAPDGQSIGFFADGKLKAIALHDNSVRVICDAPDARGGAWGDGVVVFASHVDGPLFQVPADGGHPAKLTALDATRQEASHRLPSFLPDGRHFLFMAQSGRPEHNVVHVGSIDSTEVTPLAIVGSKAIYNDGYLVYAQPGGRLVAQQFSTSSLTLEGEPFAIGDYAALRSGLAGDASFSTAGSVLAYWRGDPSVTTLTWHDRHGQVLGTVGAPGDHMDLDITRDDRKVAVETIDRETGTGDIWTIDLRNNIAARLTTDPAWDFGPAWSPDGSKIAFGSIRNGLQRLFQTSADGSEVSELLVESTDAVGGADWSLPQGPIIFQNMSKLKIGVSPLDRSSSPRLLFRDSFAENDGRLSPDGRWLAYTSNESGTWDVYVRPFPQLDRKWRVSPAGGSRPLWRRDGRELYYVGPDQMLMAAPLTPTDDDLVVHASEPLFKLRMINFPPSLPRQQYVADAKGSRFLVNTVVAPATPTPITVVMDWNSVLPERTGRQPFWRR